MKWEFVNDRPIYTQIIERIKLFIVSGELAVGARLPSVRELAADAGVNPNTMQRALSELERAGLVYANRTSGRFITEDKDMIQNIKGEAAEAYIRMFLESMRKIGYDRKEAALLLENFKMGDGNL